MNRKTIFWIALWVVLVAVTGYFAFLRGPMGMGYGPWHSWDNEEGWDDPGAYPAHRYRGWHGMPPGWMGGGWQQNEAWGRGRNYGMMGPYGSAMPGMGLGMPGFGTTPWALPGLTSEQSGKIDTLQTEQFDRSRAVMQQMWQIRGRLNELYAADKRDWEAIRSTTQQLFELQRQQHESVIELQQKIDGLLTDAQRQELARAQRGYGRMGWQ